MSTVLVVDDDVAITRYLATNLRHEGFSVEVAHDGVTAMSCIERNPPDLVLLDIVLPGIDGTDLCRRLRSEPATANLPVILMTGRTSAVDAVRGLAAGADDYILKPFDLLVLVARIRSTLRRSADMRAVSPLTGLPGNHRIDEEIVARVSGGGPFAVCYLDLDNFKAYNDVYGFLRGDEVISLLAAALHTVTVTATPVPFVGHVGGDDFVLVCAADQAEPLCRRVIEVLDGKVPALHDAEDAQRGYMEVLDRQGIVRQFPLVSVSIGIAVSGRRSFADHREVVAVATEMKSVAKASEGSSIAVDRRVDTT